MDSTDMEIPHTSSIWALICATILATLFILVWGINTPPEHAYDDAYITYRYAENWRNGLGLVYNPDEWVLGTTAPLFALLLGVAGFFFRDIETLGHWLGVLGWIGAAWAAGALFWQAKRPFAALLAMLFVALQPAMLNSLGMETPLVVAFMLISAWAWFDKRIFLAAFMMAALLVMRLDGALWAVVIGLETWRRNGRIPWRRTMFTLLLASPWFIYAQLRYGSILPNSATAKIGQVTRMIVGGQSSFLQGYWTTWNWMSSMALTAFAIILLVGMLIIVRSETRFWWLPVWIGFYLAVYVGLSVVNFSWYYVSPVVLTTLIAALGGGYLLGDGWVRARSKWQIGNGSLVKTTLIIIIMVVLIPSWFSQLKVVQKRSGYQIAYRQVGRWLNENVTMSDRVATIEVGVIGYLSQRPILDTMGLVSFEMTKHQVGWRETLAYAVTQLWPEYAVVLEGTAWDWVVNQWWFTDFYEPAANFDRASVYRLQNRPTVSYSAQTTADFLPGFSLTSAAFSSQELLPGSELDVWIHIDVQKKQAADYQLTVYLIDTQTDERTAVTTIDPLNGGYNSSVWQPGDRLVLPVRMHLPSDLSPGTYQLGLFIYNPEDGAGIPITAMLPGIYPETRFGWLRVNGPMTADITDLTPETVQVSWQQGIELKTLLFTPWPHKPGDAVPIGLQWQVTQTPARDLKLFIHIINEDGDILAQQDQRPFNGRFPTPGWQAGEQFIDVIQVQLPVGLSPGTYGLRIGWYDDNGRLPLLNGDGFIQYPSSLIIE